MSTRRSRSFTVQLGSATVTLTPHILDGIGARILIKIDEPNAPTVRLNLTPDAARTLRTELALATCEAESIERREQRRKEHAA